jgi:hypothetical protein
MVAMGQNELHQLGRRTGFVRWWPVVVTALMLLAMLVGMALAADPGSRDDPLATVSYVGRHGQFSRQELNAGHSLRLGSGAEVIVVQPGFGEVAVNGLNPMKDTLVDVTDGVPVAREELAPNHHYINGSDHDVTIRPEVDTVVLVSGEWQ